MTVKQKVRVPGFTTIAGWENASSHPLLTRESLLRIPLVFTASGQIHLLSLVKLFSLSRRTKSEPKLGFVFILLTSAFQIHRKTVFLSFLMNKGQCTVTR